MKKVLIIPHEQTYMLDGSVAMAVQLSVAECELEQLIVIVNQDEELREYPTDKYFYLLVNLMYDEIEEVEIPFI